MNDQKHIIVINGRRYNAQTGESLAHPQEAAPVVSHQAAAHKPAVLPHKAPSKPVRHPARHVAAHSPKRAETLMRQSVKKPSPGLKRKIRVQGHLASQVKPVYLEAPVRASLGKRTGPKPHIQHGRITISHFSPGLFTTVKHVPTEESKPSAHTAADPVPTMKPAFAAPNKTLSKPVSTAAHKKPLTTAELLEYVVLSANTPAEEEHPAHARHKPRRKLLKRHAHAAAAR